MRLNAVNDSFILRSCVSWLLKRTFESDSCYLQLVEMFREVCSLPCSLPNLRGTGVKLWCVGRRGRARR